MRKRNVPDLKPRPARHVTALTAMAMLAGTFGIQSCDDEVLTGQPSWLGNSIYERLAEDGNYTTTLRLIATPGRRPCSAEPAQRRFLWLTTLRTSGGSRTTRGE